MSEQGLPPFRTIGISNERFERDGLRFLTVKSRALKGRGDISLFVPPEVSNMRESPIVILLHGVYGSHWSWPFQGGAHVTAQRLIREKIIGPMIIAMPSDGLWGDGSGYTCHPDHDFESWIVDEVPKAVQWAVPAASENSKLFISGLSMGGFGALRIAGKYPERFCAAGGHSCITHFNQFEKFVEEPLASYGCPQDSKSLLETYKRNSGRLMPVRFDCGKSDPLVGENRELSRELKANGIKHLYEEFEGGHEWAYWERHLEDMLRFFSAQLK